jgi:hypothetical protein
MNQVAIPYRGKSALSRDLWWCGVCGRGIGCDISLSLDSRDFKAGSWAFCPKCGVPIDWAKAGVEAILTPVLASSPEYLQSEINRLTALLNTPELEDFDKAIVLEAAHQVERWGTAHDAGKTHPDWFWLIGYLAGKALAAAIAGNIDKAKHHCISTAAALRNWHAHLRTGQTAMRPGIEDPR